MALIIEDGEPKTEDRGQETEHGSTEYTGWYEKRPTAD
jgi:hypothetical protein